MIIRRATPADLAEVQRLNAGHITVGAFPPIRQLSSFIAAMGLVI